MAKVSIVIPVYKVEKYIERCVRSLFEQTLDSIEYIFVDDCSPDNSIGVLQKILEEYPLRKDQVKILRHETNQGVGAARNHGVAACTGDYIIHCDPDDWVDIKMYETMYNKAIETDADMVYCDYYENTENITKSILHSGNCNAHLLIEDILYEKVHAALWNKLVKREIALSPQIYCPNHIVMCEDLLRTVQMLLGCNKISYLGSAYYFYRQSPVQMTKKWSFNTFQNIFEVNSILEKQLSDNYSKIFDHRRHLLLLSMIKRRKISSKKFYSIKHSIKSSCWTDPYIPFYKKTVFYIGCILYWLLPKELLDKN